MDDNSKLSIGWVSEHSDQNLDLNIESRKTLYFDMLYDIIHDDFDRGSIEIDSIASLDLSERAIANLGAGPLESLLLMHGQKAMDWLKVTSKISPNLKRAASHVWLHAVPVDIANQLSHLVNDDLM